MSGTQCVFSHCKTAIDEPRKYKIPLAKNFANKNLAKLSKLRRKKWIKVIGNDPAIQACVCFRHFQSGKPCSLKDFRNPDWAPNLNLGNRKIVPPTVEKLGVKKYEIKEVLICRLCLEEKKQHDLIPLFNSKLDDGLSTIEVIQFATPLIIAEDDGCPEKICKSCLQRVISAYQLKKECLQTNQIMFENLPSFYPTPQEDISEIIDYEPKYQELEEESNFQDSFIYTMDKTEVVVQPPSLLVQDHSMNQHYEIIEEDYQDYQEIADYSESKINPSMEVDEEIPYETEVEKSRLELEQLKKTNFSSTCYLCDLNFLLRGEKKLHYEEVHAQQEMFVCKICSFSSKSYRVLNDKHYKIHYQGAQCEACGVSFPSIRLMENHKISNHMTAEEKEKLKQKECPICNRKFIFQSVLNKHLKTHTDNKQFSCGECFQKFTSKIACERHQLSHGYQAKYICQNESCRKGFVVLNEFTRHQEKCGIVFDQQ